MKSPTDYPIRDQTDEPGAPPAWLTIGILITLAAIAGTIIYLAI